MARPPKNNADYFTHDADMRNDVKVKALRRRFSHTGYAVWNYLLETLTDNDFFEMAWDEIAIELLAADYDVSVSDLTAIVDYCVKIGLLQRDGNCLSSAVHKKRLAGVIEYREQQRENGRKGGNPNFRKGQPNPYYRQENDNPQITGGDADPGAALPEDKQSKAKESKAKESTEGIIYPYQDIVARWNAICRSLPRVVKLSDARRAKIRRRLHEFGGPESWMPTIEVLFGAVESTDFLRGGNKQNWRATFDWVFENETNWVKVVEGNYADCDRQRTAGFATLGSDERIENGRRTYGSGRVSIPMDAPPRPGDKYAWDSSTQKWILL